MKKIKTFIKSLATGSVLVPGVALAQTEGSFGLEYAENLQLGTQDVRETVFQIVNVILGFLGIVAIILVLWGGFMWMTSQGNEEKTGTARKIIISGIIGLGIVLASYAITSFVLSQLYTATGGTTL